MTGLPWYKCEPARFNDGMIGLTVPERAFYPTIINCIYIEGGPVKDDPVYWTAVFGCSQAVWLKGRAGLIAKGKLHEAPTKDGLSGLMNRKCADEIDNQQKYKSGQATHGQNGGKKSRRKPRKDKGVRRPLGQPKGTLRQALGYPKEIKRKRKNLLPSQKGANDLSSTGSGPNVIALAGRGDG